jgi:acyl-CoA synthetase (NDP forming)
MDMKDFFFPDSILVFGVSDRAGNLGREVFKNLNRFGFKGSICGFGRNEMEIEGRRVYSDIRQVPGTPDVAILLVPAVAIAGAMEECGKKGITHAVIEAGGFSELGAERKTLEDDIRRVAAENGIACMGPNCIGVINVENGLCMPFVPFDPNEMRVGKNSFIAQSGGLIHEMVRRCSADNVGLSKATSIGNKLILDENDVLEYLLQDQETEVVGVYLEDVKNGRRLMNIASGSAKPVVLLKGNASPSAREIAQFHTTALLGDEAVTEAALRQAGIHQVGSPQEMVDCFKVFGLPPMKGSRIVIASRSGGQSVLLADEAYRNGFSLAALPAGLFEMIGERSKGSVIKRTNPIDLGDVYDESFYLDVLDKALEDDGVDGVVFFFDYELNGYRAFDIVGGVERLCSLHQKPVVLCMVPDRDNWFKVRYASPFPFFTEPERGFAALRRSLAHHRRMTAGNGRFVFRDSAEKTNDSSKSPFSPRIVSAREALSLMESYGIPVVDYELVGTVDEAGSAAHRIGYPVVLKQVEPFILHKTEEGAVRLNIRNDEGLAKAFAEGKGDLYLLQKMAPAGVETIIGGKQDSEFGPVVIFGLGGVFVEVLKDVTMRIAPVDEASAREMIEEIRGASLLKGARGAVPCDLDGLTRAIVGVSNLLAAHPEIISLDVNPFVVFQEGSGGCALDVKMEMADESP